MLTFSFEVARRLLIGVIFVFLTAEALIDKMDKDTLAQVTELIHALPIVENLGLSLIQSGVKMLEDVSSVLYLLSGLLTDTL